MNPVNDFLDTEDVYPEEVLDSTGLFYFPDDKRIAVSCNGAVKNLRTGKWLKGSPAENGNLYFHITEPGKPRQVYSQHRVVARTFVGRPTRHLEKHFRELEVNHIDLIRTHNHYLNLEWVTGKENIAHFTSSDKNKRYSLVLSRNFLTNEIRSFKGIRECARHFDISAATLHKCLQKELTHLFHCDNWIFKYDNGKEWPVIDRRIIMRLGRGTAGTIILAESQTSDQHIVFTDIGECAMHFHLSYRTVRRKLKRTGAFEYAGYLIKRCN